MLNDLWRRPQVRLQITEDRAIWREGQKTIRGLVIGLVIVGLLFAVMNAWVMQRLVVRRVERLIRLTSDTETEAGLNARVNISGSDELAQLGHRMNKMLERLQNSNDALLSIQERLRYEATHDNLTGIWNRGVAMRLLDQELARSSREGSVVSVILFDADHFKEINDTYGHSTGDRALQTIAAAITRNLRNSDVCCRYGGEEFLVIAPNCNLENATQLAQRILAYLRETPVTIFEHSFRVTLSAGVTACSPGCKAEDLIMVADRALYRAKELGRDRIEAETLPTDTAARNQRFAPSGLPQPT
jgi:diguanylate cyclase (GGDEF)-like protein